MKTLSRILTVISLGLLITMGLADQLAAQEGGRVQIRTYSLSGDISELMLAGPDGGVQMTIPSARRSQALGYRGKPELIFFRAVDQLEEGKLIPAARVNISGKGRAPLLIFQKQEKPAEGELPYKVWAIDDSLNGFPAGSCRFVNLSNKPLMLLLGPEGKDRVSLGAGAEELHRLGADFKGNLAVKAAYRENGKVVPAFDSRVFPAKGCRDIYFIWPLSRAEEEPGNKIRLSVLRERSDYARKSIGS